MQVDKNSQSLQLLGVLHDTSITAVALECKLELVEIMGPFPSKSTSANYANISASIIPKYTLIMCTS